MSETCRKCGAKCCRYFCFQIDEPDDYDEFDDIRWFLLHKDVTVHVDDDGDWYISIANRCKMLGRDNRCKIYETRPTICRKYEMANCDQTGGDYGYDEYFETPEDVDRYARKILGKKVFDKARAKAWGLKTKKKKKGQASRKGEGGEMKIQAVKGTRDFYPEQMRLRNWIVETWRRVSLRNGFEEYDSPIFEYLDLFTIKSGEEIAEQLFNFTDRGGRSLAIRAEITPSLARMVNAKINSLPRPIKWFSVPRVCRAERPQRGRLREFFQWNVDVIGTDSVLADVECIFTAVDFLREVGLSPDDVSVRIGSRALTAAALHGAGVADDRLDAVLPVLDKRPKVSEAEFHRLAVEAGLSDVQIAAVCRFQDARTLEEVSEAVGEGEVTAGPLSDLSELLTRLGQAGAGEYCRLDMRIVRGLAYYTGIVYEIFDAGESLRAVAGGGRYDNLLETLGGPKVGATGFGMGDVVLGILLEEKDKVPEAVRTQELEYFVIGAADGVFQTVLEVVGALRHGNRTADFSYKSQNVGKLLKEANRRGARKAVLVREDRVAVKDLATGNQNEMALSQFLENPR